jgi:hypothetical protein
VGEIDLAIPWGWLSKSVLYINQKDKNPYKSKDEIFFLLNTALRREVERNSEERRGEEGQGVKLSLAAHAQEQDQILLQGVYHSRQQRRGKNTDGHHFWPGNRK